MNRHGAPSPVPSRKAVSGILGGARGVAVVLAVALLAGFTVFWLTRPTTGMSGVPEADSLGTSVGSAPVGTPSPTTDAPTSGVSTGVKARPATQSAGPSLPAPTRFTIARLDIDMPVKPVGVARDGEMALPRTPAEMGWYEFGPRPGDPRGATVLAAHLDMPGYGTGPIAAVDALRRGDEIVVRSGSRTTRYAVTDVRSIRKSTLDLGALFTRDGDPVLHVVTCGGTFDPESRRYDRNIVITAAPVS